jgi:riboflavin kinase/FMN adenylyltransferase
MSFEIIDWEAFSDSPQGSGSAMTVGVFDGVHLGHRSLIELIVRRGPNPTVLTFRENPKKLVSPGSYEGDIFSLKQKLASFEKLGVSRVVLIDFSEKFSKLNGSEFFDLIEKRGKMAFLAIGSNFRCGFQQKTDADFIRTMNKRKGIPTELVLPLEAAGKGPVSSSRIRSAIISGNFALAAALMGRGFELDVSDLKPAGLAYDLGAVHRIVPKTGQYPVLIKPGACLCRADVKDGKVFVPIKQDCPAESIEFLGE